MDLNSILPVQTTPHTKQASMTLGSRSREALLLKKELSYFPGKNVNTMLQFFKVKFLGS